MLRLHLQWFLSEVHFLLDKIYYLAYNISTQTILFGGIGYDHSKLHHVPQQHEALFRRHYKREHVIVNRQGEENVMMISMDEWNEIQKQLSNLAYLRKLEESEKQLAAGRTVTKTIEQLEDMENE